MKNWLLYFFAIIISLFSVTAASKYLYSNEAIPTISVCRNGNIEEITIDEYALLVLLAEGENCNSYESQRALAVASRSVGAYLSVFGCKHGEYDACDRGDCCIMLGNRETANEDFLTQCEAAVKETSGNILTFKELPAMSLFCLCSGTGSGNCNEFTYLSSVKNQKVCQAHITQSTHEYSLLTPLLLTEADLNTLQENSVLIYDENKKCDFGILAGVKAESNKIIAALNLKSSEFTLEFSQDGILSTAYGVGHGYGMSLCEAEKLSETGWGWEKILKHFYPNLILKKIYNN